MPLPKEEGEICFFLLTTSPVELGAQAGAAKLLSPCTQGPLAWGTISSLSPNPAGVQREGRSEIRSPMEQALRESVCCLLVLNLVSSTLPCIRRPRPRLQPLKGQDCRSRARRGPSEISIPGDPSPGPAGSMGCWLRPRIPKPAGASESRARRGSVETHVSRDPSPWPAGSTGCLRGLQRIPNSSLPLLAPQLLVKEQRFGSLGSFLFLKEQIKGIIIIGREHHRSSCLKVPTPPTGYTSGWPGPNEAC